MRKFIMTLVAIGFLTAPMLMLQGCGDYTGDTENHYEESHYTFIDNGIEYGSGTVLNCDDANCSVMLDNSGTPVQSDDENASDGDAVVGVYSASYSQSECNAAGFFFCTIEDKCLNQRVDDSSSSCSSGN